MIAGSGGKTRSFKPEWDRDVSVRSMAEVVFQAAEYAKDKNVVPAVGVRPVPLEAVVRYL